MEIKNNKNGFTYRLTLQNFQKKTQNFSQCLILNTKNLVKHNLKN